MAFVGCGSSPATSDAGPPRMGNDAAEIALRDATASPANAATGDAAPESEIDAASVSDADAGLSGDSGQDAVPLSNNGGTDAAPTALPDGGIQPPSTLRCGNWADPRDNFVNGNLQLSGLSATTDTLATVTAKADSLLAAFQATTGANAVRIPINERTVLGPWWSAYKGVIDAALARGMRVLVAYWAWHPPSRPVSGST